jgi:hypothetical protein
VKWVGWRNGYRSKPKRAARVGRSIPTVEDLASKPSQSQFESVGRHMIHNCFKCLKELEPVSKEDNFPQCYAAVTFAARGNYGSTVFDPMDDRSSLVIMICDECLVRDKAQVTLLTTTTRLIDQYEQWIPDKF